MCKDVTMHIVGDTSYEKERRKEVVCGRVECFESSLAEQTSPKRLEGREVDTFNPQRVGYHEIRTEMVM